MKIRILPNAEKDLEIGADFYESQCDGLGAYFVSSLIYAVLDCRQDPAKIDDRLDVEETQ